jgi:enoyl-CoA hydratase/carnithine racemase
MLPAACGTQSLPRAIGPSRALPLVMTGGEIDAAEAKRLEMVHEVDEDPEAIARRWAEGLARTAAAGAAALALRAAVDLDLATGLRHERRLARSF